MNFISAGLKKAAAEDGSEEDSEEDERPPKQEEAPKEFVPKKLKTVRGPRRSRLWAVCLGSLGGRGTMRGHQGKRNNENRGATRLGLPLRERFSLRSQLF